MSERPLFESGWEVDGLKDAERFFASLHMILPPAACLVFEGVRIAPDLRRLLESAAVPPRRHIPVGTIRPKPVTFHVLASATLLDRIAELASNHTKREICNHLHAYDDAGGLLQWYDAFVLPLLAAASIPEDRLKNFCDALEASHGRWKARERPP